MSVVEIENIHADILKYIFAFLQDEDVAVARFVCRRWKRFLPHPIYVTCAAYVQYPHVIRWARLNGCPWFYEGVTCTKAFREGIADLDLSMLQWLAFHDAQFCNKCLSAAIQKCRPVEILDFIHSRMRNGNLYEVPSIDPVGLNPIPFLEWACEMKFPASSCVEKVLSTLYKQKDTRIIDVLRWVKDNASQWGPIYLDVLAPICQWGTCSEFEEAIRLFPWNLWSRDRSFILSWAASAGRKDIIDWVIAHDMKLRWPHIFSALRHGHFDLAKEYLPESAPENAPTHLYREVTLSGSPNALSMLQWMYDHGYPLPASDNTQLCCDATAFYSYPLSVELLTWFFQRGQLYGDHMFAAPRDVKTLRWLLDHHRPITFSLFIHSIGYETVNCDVLLYIIEENLSRCTSLNRCTSWYRIACLNGRLDMIKAMYKKGFRVGGNSRYIYFDAASGNHLHILQWFHEKRFLIPYEELLRKSLDEGRRSITRWLRSLRR